MKKPYTVTLFVLIAILPIAFYIFGFEKREASKSAEKDGEDLLRRSNLDTTSSDLSMVDPNTVENGQETPTAAIHPVDDVKVVMALLKDGEIKQAKEILKEILAKDPTRDDVDALLGDIYMDEDNLIEAYKHYREALDSNELNERALIMLPEVLEAGLSTDVLAKQNLTRLYKDMEQKIDSPALQIGLAKLDAQDNNSASSLDRLKKASQDPQFFTEAVVESGLILSKTNRHNEAVKFYEERIQEALAKSSSLPKDWDDVRINYALTLLQHGDLEKARAQVEILKQESPEADLDGLVERIQLAESRKNR